MNMAPSENKTNKASQKRGRSSSGRGRAPLTQEEVLSLQQERYDRLFYTLHKLIHKQAKVVKNFLVQKEIRHQKQHQQQNQKNGVGNSKIQNLKGLDLDLVTQQALVQLGLYHSNPSLKKTTTKITTEIAGEGLEDAQDEKDDNNNSKHVIDPSSSIPARLEADDPRNEFVNAILTHKRLLQTMEDVNHKVTEYRQWCLETEMERDRVVDLTNSINNKKKRKKSTKRHSNGNSRQHDPLEAGLHDTAQEPSAMFCTLDGMDKNDQHHNNMEDDGVVPKKKNRMGQRARKAKAMAIQAKEEGRSDYQSLNWRAPKANKNDEEGENDRNDGGSDHKRSKDKRHHSSSSDDDHRKAISAPVVADHPSWVAKQAQSTGIVAFQGKKITFD
jgi:BUD22